MKSSRKRNIFFLIIFLILVVLSYSIVSGGDAKVDTHYDVIYTSHNLSGHLVTKECPDKNCNCSDDDVGIAVNECYGEITSNVQGRKNTYANAIGYKKFIETFPKGNPIALGIYKYTGQVRLPVLPFPNVNQTENPQAVQMMIPLWDGRDDLWDSNNNTLEGTIYWDLNPWTPDGKNGTIKIYNKSVEDLVDTGINRIDTDWHTFELVVDFLTKKYVSITFDNETKDLSNYELVQVDHGPGSPIPWNDTNVSLSITTESLAAWPYPNNTFTWTTQFKDLEFSAKPTPCIIDIDTMDSTLGWKTYRDDTGSSIHIESIPGRTDNAIEITHDLEEWGWVVISKRIDPEILSEIERIRFFYKGNGTPSTIELKLVYGDLGGTTFGVLWNGATVTDDWVSFEVPYSRFDCWWPEDNCLRYGNELDLTKVRKIEFAISNKPEDGDMYGSGIVIIDDVQGITPQT